MIFRRRYQRLELRHFTYHDADQLIKHSHGAWTIAPEEDTNHAYGMVWLQRLGLPLCIWWRRWWHIRQRSMDIQFVIIPLTEQARERGMSQSDLDDSIRLFKSLPGQAHWHCPCAHPEGRSTYDTGTSPTVNGKA